MAKNVAGAVAKPAPALNDNDDDEPDEDDLVPEQPQHTPHTIAAGKEVGMAEKVGAGGDPKPAEAKVIPIAEHQAEKAAARAQGQADEKARMEGIMELASIARLPAEKASAEVARLISTGATIDEARRAFVDLKAKVEKDEGGGEILGHTADVARITARHTMKSREEIFAARAARMRGPLSARAALPVPKEA